jgi:hypothetical protein
MLDIMALSKCEIYFRCLSFLPCGYQIEVNEWMIFSAKYSAFVFCFERRRSIRESKSGSFEIRTEEIASINGMNCNFLELRGHRDWKYCTKTITERSGDEIFARRRNGLAPEIAIGMVGERESHIATRIGNSGKKK